jgi:hypothetical protein
MLHSSIIPTSFDYSCQKRMVNKTIPDLVRMKLKCYDAKCLCLKIYGRLPHSEIVVKYEGRMTDNGDIVF